MGKNAKDYRLERDEAYKEIARLKGLPPMTKERRPPVVHLMCSDAWSYCGSVGGFGTVNDLPRTDDPDKATCINCINYFVRKGN